MTCTMQKDTNIRIISSDVAKGESKMRPLNPGMGVRHLQSLLLSFCMVCGFLQRVNLSVTIIAMSKEASQTSTEGEPDFPTYEWDNEIRSYLLSSFFLGYLIMNFPASVLGVYFDKKLLLVVSFLANGLLACFTPYLITFTYTGSVEVLKRFFESTGPGNWKLLIVLRVVQGLIQAFMLPTIHGISAKWSPPHERSRLVGFILAGIPLGTMITLAGSGILASNPYMGWPSVFYVSGGAGIVWALTWWWLGANNPASHPTISADEYLYIISSLPPETAGRNKKNVPWKKIVASLPVWSVVIIHLTHNWGFWLLLTEMPTFMNAILGFNIKSDGLLSAIPYLCMWLFQFPVMYLADKFNQKKITSITSSRKIWSSISVWGGAVGMVILGYLDDNVHAAIIFYVVVVALSCCTNVSGSVNHMDLSPNYAGVLMGMSNGVAACGGLLAPLMVAYFVTDINSVTQWRTVFYVSSAVLFVGNLFFVIFGSGKTQKWNNE